MLPSKAFAAALEIVKADIITRKMEELQPKPRSKVISRQNERIENSRDVVRISGAGVLKEFKIKSPTDAFNVEVMWEKGTIKGSYTELIEKAACYEEDGSYFLHITDVEFTEYLIVVVSVEEPTTFNLIYAQLTLKER